ncbi:MAG TPA: prephenate dehydrogenase/arogenate dehydrogenase family protein [Cytophagales bacterium]|nr:prephenate dehydrogenase/arogenate dehydrogenase family protein [Cytophagales bacterium]
MIHEISFIGFGNFGQFIVKYLTPFAQVYAHDSRDYSKQAKQLGVTWLSAIEEALNKQVIVLCVPVQHMEELLVKIGSRVKPDALVVDVASVKVKPVELMKKYLPESVQIAAIHPLFGPQSGKFGIESLNVVVCEVRYKKFNRLVDFLQQKLKLNTLIRTPQVHDMQMAYVQALTHFIGRAVNEMDVPDVEQKTPAYQYLLDIKRNLGQDSWDLFLTIENENPFAAKVRQDFLNELYLLNKKLEEGL